MACRVAGLDYPLPKFPRVRLPQAGSIIPANGQSQPAPTGLP
ncbi:hypothetical protein Pla86_20610 [Planctomycetes bacterium Pla86]|uniref:Uncharacterized protein n=1 Tax=Engelhardtia mirabilis TaxID=2528011 RepID=A0A518BJ38_9BACT|nr:hypothetical protein Pla133_20610 [Planctomycetes bacterium Pla133]QDV01311.1 hypothetical protein Pla86_20610 [Planctomycetes bacterium Pla86]